MNVLSSTSIYKYTEMVGGTKLSATLAKLIDEKSGAMFITEDQLEDVFYKIRHKSFNYRAKFGVIDLFRKKIIRLVYNPTVKVTVSVPFIPYKMPNGFVGCIVNISNYATIDSTTGFVRIDPLVLYTLMLSAAYNINNLTLESTLANNGFVDLYSDMFVAVIAKMTNLDMTRREKIRYIISKYLYLQLGYNEPRANTAAGASLKYLDSYAIENINLEYPIDSFKDLESLINIMRDKNVEMSKITFGMVFDKWMRTYGEASGFAIEYIPYFITIFCSLIVNCPAIANVKAIEKEAVSNSKKLMVLFDRIETDVQTLSTKV